MTADTEKLSEKIFFDDQLLFMQEMIKKLIRKFEIYLHLSIYTFFTN